jgi:hypothetical protein
MTPLTMSYDTLTYVYVSVGLTDQARDALREAVLNMTTPAGRKLSMSEVLLAALAIAKRHPDELLETLSAEAAK